jgi:hypothetical protein
MVTLPKPFGKVFVTEREAEQLTPSEREQAIIVPKLTTAQIIRRIGTGRAPTPSAPPSAPPTISQAQKDELRKELEKQRRFDFGALDRQFRKDIVGVTGAQARLDLVNKLNQAKGLIDAKFNLNKIEQGISSSITLKTTEGDIKVTSGNIEDIKTRLGLGKIKITEKPPTVISPFIPVGEKITPPLTIRIKQFIRTKIPGGASIVRNIEAGKETLIDIEKRFPVLEDFVKKQKVPEGFVEEIKIRPPFGFPKVPRRETIIEEKILREKTFEERLGIKEDKDSKTLKTSAELIQEQFSLGKISEEQANARLDDSLTKFMNKKAVKGIPKNVAIGIGIGLLSTIPILGPVVSTALVSNAILRRRQLVGQFKRFPKASAITTASFLAGGLAGRVAGGQIKSKFNNKIDPDSIKSVTIIGGKEKTRLLKQAQQVYPDFKIAFKTKKVTGTIAYEVATKDGRTFKILEFNKLTPGDLKAGLRGEKNFLGFQTGLPRGELLVGKGVSVIVDGKSSTFIKALRFKPVRSPVGRLLQRFGFKRAKAFDILEKSIVVKQRGQTAQIISEARILQMKSVSRSLAQRIANIERRFNAGQKITPADIKNLINLERRAEGLKPFTEIEFRQAGTPIVTSTIIQSLLKKARVSLTRTDNLIRLSIKAKEDVAGAAFATPGEFFKVGITKAKITKTPFSKTFGKEPITIVDFSKQVRTLFDKSKTATTSQLKTISKQIQNLKARVVGTPGGITLALAQKLETPTPKIIPGAVPFVTTPSVFFGVPGRISLEQETELVTIVDGRLSFEQRFLIGQSDGINLKLKNFQSNITKLKQELKEKQRLKLPQSSILSTRTQLITRQRQVQNLKQVQKIAQKLKLKQRQLLKRRVTTIRRPRVPPGAFPLIPTPLLIGVEPKKKVVKKIPSKKLGYHSFAKQKGRFIKLSKRPLTKSKALDLSAFFVDKSLSATGRIRRAKKPAKKPLIKIPDKYFKKTAKKYRLFKIKKGKKVPLVNEFIELRKFRLDTKRETQTIQQLRKRLIKKQKLKKPKIKQIKKLKVPTLKKIKAPKFRRL